MMKPLGPRVCILTLSLTSLNVNVARLPGITCLKGLDSEGFAARACRQISVQTGTARTLLRVHPRSKANTGHKLSKESC
ncbi:hypothetical protein EJ02DRAFT_453218 [Clathrospora elynae]|uniref:Secreted protein n=1 Tax=Clathrospora elynae TaxID=706981 RepID=A0A6A5SY99_9PLEO|nr:hypothetical protein EJ02DRAFT_453218 [Clathrospora elynae]